MDVITYCQKVILAWLGVIVGISLNVEDIKSLSKRGRSTFQRYGVPFVLVLRGALEAYYQVEHVLEAPEENLRYYQESLIMECNMIAVASAIVSSITITTYGFNSILDMHWTVPAAFTLSLVLSLFCVYGAVSLQRRISNLPTGKPFRAWLTEPSLLNQSNSQQPYGSDGDTFTSKSSYIDDPLRANVATVLTLTAPKTLLDHSIRFFLVGLVGYLSCLHTLSIRTPPTSSSAASSSSSAPPVILSPSMSSASGSRNVIIVCAFTLCIGISLLISPSSYKNFKLTLAANAATSANAFASANHVAHYHGHGNAGLAEGPTWEGGGHHNQGHHNHDHQPHKHPVTGQGPENVRGDEKDLTSTTQNGVSGGFQQLQSHFPGGAKELVTALREASAAHERNAVAAREVAAAEARVARIYAGFLVQ